MILLGEMTKEKALVSLRSIWAFVFPFAFEGGALSFNRQDYCMILLGEMTKEKALVSLRSTWGFVFPFAFEAGILKAGRIIT